MDLRGATGTAPAPKSDKTLLTRLRATSAAWHSFWKNRGKTSVWPVIPPMASLDLCVEDSLESDFFNLAVDEEEGDDPIGKKGKLKETPLDDSLFKAYSSLSSNGKISLEVSKQPEKQYRYYNEGCKWAIKGRELNSFPTVQLRGYDPKKLAVLQVFLGRDTSTLKPHLYYQAFKVSSKSSTPCREIKKDNTGSFMSLPKNFLTIKSIYW